MPDVRMPDGVVVRFPDDMPPDQIKALIVQKFPDLAQQQAAPQEAPAPQPAQQQPVGPGGSPRAFQAGAMEGMTGNFLDEIMAGAMTPIEMGIDAFQGKGFDPGRSFQQAYAKNRDLTQGEKAADPNAALMGNITGALVTGGQLAKSGATLMAGAKPTIVSMGTRGALEGAGYGAVYGAGEGEGLQDRLLKAGTGTLLGGALGGLTGGIAGAFAQKANPKAAIPELDQLQSIKDAAYQAVDSSGARYKPEAVDDLLTDIIRRTAKDNISPTRHEKAYSLLIDLESRRGPMSLTQLDQLRQEIRRDLVSMKDGGEAHFGQIMIDAIDDFIEKSGPAQMAAGDAQVAAQAIQTARKANSTLRKSELIQEAIDRATRRVAATGSGGNIDNAIRQELNRILSSPTLSRGFTQAEKNIMDAAIKGMGKGQGLLRLIGKLSPSGNGLMAALGLGATVTNPLMAAAPAAGLIAKSISDNATRGAIQNVSNVVRTGGVPVANSAVPSVMGAMMPAQGMIAPKLPELAGRLLSPANR
jgi:hypothetical protein